MATFRSLVFVLGFLLSANALALPRGGGTAQQAQTVTCSPSATTIYCSWSSGSAADTALFAGTSNGVYNIPAADNGYQFGVTSHSGILAGLSPSTTYFVKAIGGDTLYATVTTQAAAATTAVTSVTWGTPSRPVPDQNHGDFYANAVDASGVTYVQTNDSGPTTWASAATPASMQLGKFTNMSPLTGATVNLFSNFGPWATPQPPDSSTPKASGVFIYDGNQYFAYSRNYFNTGTQTSFAYDANIFSSSDNGVTWANPEGGSSVDGPIPPITNGRVATIFGSWVEATFTGSGSGTTLGVSGISGNLSVGDIISGTGVADYTLPYEQTSGTTGGNGNYTTNNATSASGTITATRQACGVASFVTYGADNGTTLPAYRVHNADAYVYFVCAAHNQNYQADQFFMARMPLAALLTIKSGGTFDSSRIQYYKGGADGLTDAAWSTTPSDQAPILTNAGKLVTPGVQYFPLLNRYMLFTEYRANPAVLVPTTWITYEAPYPWGPWTLIDTTSWNPCGWYYPFPLMADAVLANLGSPAFTMIMSGDYTNDACYQLTQVSATLH